MSVVETLELTLKRPDKTRVVVYWGDEHRSHHFDLAAIPQGDSQEPGHFLIDRNEYGAKLYQLLFPQETAAYDELIKKPERILLVLPDAVLDAVAWEYLRGPDGFLAEELSIMRGLPAEERIALANYPGELHIVAVPSNPLSKDLPQLSIEEDWRHLTEIVNAQLHKCLLQRTRPPNIDRLRQLISSRTDSIVHFIGHGKQDKQGVYLCFEEYNGAEALITARRFVEHLRGHIFLVTLSACLTAASGPGIFSNLAAALMHEKVPYTLGMRAKIPDSDAQNFTKTFYSELVSGNPVEEAVRLARWKLPERYIGTPVLYTALSTRPTAIAASAGKPDINAYLPRMEGENFLPRPFFGTFTGRIDDLQELGSQLTSSSRPPIISVYGTGGQGKTVFAREAIERFAFAWPGGVWATTFETLPTRAAFAMSLARFIDPQSTGIEAQSDVIDTIERDILARFQRQNQRILLVLDNFETLIEATNENSDAADLNRFIMRLPSSSVSLLITSREYLHWPNEYPIKLDGLSDEDGAMLFKKWASSRKDEITEAWEQSKTLSNKLEGHPLSLSLLGGAFNSNPITLNAFIEDFEQQLLHAEAFGGERRHRTLYACFETSIGHLSEEQKKLLGILRIFTAPFRPETATAIFDPIIRAIHPNALSIHANLYNLSKRGLLVRKIEDSNVEFYWLLPVVRYYIQKFIPLHFDETNLLQRFGKEHARIAQTIYTEIEQGNTASSSLTVQQTYTDLEAGAKYVENLERGSYYMHLGWISYKLGGKLKEASLLTPPLEALPEQEPPGGVQEALRLFEGARLIMRERHDHAGEAKIVNTMAKMYKQIGEPYKASDLYVEVMNIMQETRDTLGEARALNELAILYQATGRGEEAHDLLTEALAIVHPAEDRPENQLVKAKIMHNLASFYEESLEHTLALEKYDIALQIERELNDHAGEAMTLNGMFRVYDAVGNFREALSSKEQAIAILERAGLLQDADGQTLDAMRKDLQILLEREVSRGDEDNA